VPIELLNDKKTVKKIRDQRAASMNDQEMQQRKLMIAEILKKITPALEKGLISGMPGVTEPEQSTADYEG
jgi:hypothetical protein